MRKITLLLLGVLVSIGTLSAAEMLPPSDITKKGLANRYRKAQPITFIERGVTFQVYSDGTLDVKYGRRGFRRANRYRMNAGYGLPFRSSYDYFRGKRILRNRYGQIIKIGFTSINYDYFGRVKRAGSITMHYGRFKQLRRVGGMRVWFNKRGRLIYAKGHVKPHFCGICGINGCTMEHFDHRNNGWDRHDNWYYDHNDNFFDHDDDDDDHFYRKNRKRQKRNGYDSD
ncbi:MAG: hypothetical protein HKN89_08240 [Eudoraea sp.]|nr:hypothetical protein [Eudoraea sp.]